MTAILSLGIDVVAEREYVKRARVRWRELYCSMACFRTARDAATGAAGRALRAQAAARGRAAARRDRGLQKPETPERAA